ncbi:Mitochondrial matrix Mmp37 [Cynara cardunculus var. scolymus]|uniref:Phosphatidate cytidylyltransferase, mitochondrial n=1 Tax=Cynara cardunculus var. scolymus TaxID=59895 RepID=A0A103XWT2_CYNCS|nr:Mitochondrial matrix Mmp37 [Cynara cardunculus var. scolymus]
MKFPPEVQFLFLHRCLSLLFLNLGFQSLSCLQSRIGDRSSMEKELKEVHKVEYDAMKTSLGSLLKILPPVDFCCVYGSSLHPNNNDKSSMEDYILGVSNPQQWHSELNYENIGPVFNICYPSFVLLSTKNLKMNRDHYSSWMVPFGGAKLITKVADQIGVGVHFNPFVSWNNKMYKYGVVHMDDLVHDMLSWERFYLSGRLQKPVRIIVDNMEIENVNLVNLRAASSAALLLLPSTFTERELYAKICSLSYMGDLRMLFAEDKNKVKKIVEGQFELFRNMYKPLVEEYATKQLLRLSSSGDNQMNISQDCSLSATSSIVSSLPESITIGSREQAATCMQKVLRRRVMISSARQAVAGFITVGAVHGFRYLGKKMTKAWKSSA